jgi:glycerol-3-phosphate dehydrogenase (NAD(P)+)
VRLICDRIAEKSGRRVVGVGGPSKANEVGLGLPTAAIFGSTDQAALDLCVRAFNTPVYSVETTDDLTGVELGAALKNAYAIAVSVATGMEFTSAQPYQNFKAALIQAAGNELASIAEQRGGRASTIYGLAGFGDLAVTVSAGRNRLLGELLGGGMSVADALASISSTQMTIEGYASCQLGYDLMMQTGSHPDQYPLLAALYRVLYEDAPVFESLWNAIRAW